MVARNLRQSVAQSGTFVAVPSAFPEADEAIRNVLKLEFRPFISEDIDASSDPLKIGTSFASDRCLIDFMAIDFSALDGEKIAVDCELVAQVAREQPEKLRQLIAAQQEPGGFSKAAEIAAEVGLTESSAVAAGGGLLWLVVVAVVLAAGSCEHCHASHPSHDQ